MREFLTTLDTQEAPIGSSETEPVRLLSNRDRDILLALMDADPEPTEAAKKAAAEYNKGWYKGEVYHFQIPAPNAETNGRPNL